MRSLRPALVSALGVCLIFIASSLFAQRTFVSAVTGNDANPCTRSSPCRTFAAAIAAVAAGGEVIALDSGGYGAFTVSKAVSVETPAGIYAGISAGSGDGIDVSAGASDVVVLRGLTIYGFGGANDGINFTSGAALYAESCVINGFSLYGIFQTGNGNLFLTDTTVRNGGSEGVTIEPSIASNLSVDHCRFENDITGLIVFDGVKASIRSSVASGNVNGFVEDALGTAPAELNIENCMVTNNSGYGIFTVFSGPGTVRISGSTVTGNGTGLRQASGHTIESFGDNHVRGNGNDISGTITIVPNN